MCSVTFETLGTFTSCPVSKKRKKIVDFEKEKCYKRADKQMHREAALQGPENQEKKNNKLAFTPSTSPQSHCSHAFYLSNQNSFVTHSWDTANFTISWGE